MRPSLNNQLNPLEDIAIGAPCEKEGSESFVHQRCSKVRLPGNV